MSELENQEYSEDQEEIQEEKVGETKEEKFQRLGTMRMSKTLHAISQLGNLSNTNAYAYSQDQVDKMFATLEKRVADTKAKFSPAEKEDTDSFSF